MFKKVLFTAVSMLLVASLASAQNYLDEDIDEDLTLNPVAYIVRAQTEGDGIIEIINNATLTISAGCTLQFMSERSIVVNGGSALTASGTAVNPITFTSIGVLDNPSSAEAGDWGQIIFAGDDAVDVATGTFSHCVIEYGGNIDDDPFGYPDGAAVMVAGFADLTVEYSTVRTCKGTGLGVNYGNTSDPVTVSFLYNDIYHCNTGIKVFDHDASSIVIEGNNIIKTYRESGDTDAEYSGMGIFINTGNTYTTFTMKNNCIAYSGSHGVVTNDVNEFYNNTIIHSMLCGFVYDGVLTVTDHFTNNIVYGFSEQWGIDSVGVYARTSINAKNCCVYDPAADGFYNVTPNDTIRTLPGLLDDVGYVPEDLDLHLMFSSLCLHAGDSTAAADTNLNGTHIDMGAYGGIKARDYYMGITGTLPDGGSITGEKGSPFYVTGEIMLLAGDEFEIASANEDLVFEHGPSAKWTILGDLNIRGISNSVNDSRVIFKRADPAVGWTGIRFYGSSNDTMEYVEISGSESGLKIEHTAQVKCGKHLVIRDIDDDGILSTSSSSSIFTDVDISCAGDYGLRCTGGAVSFSLGRIDSCGTGISIINSTGSLIDSSVIAYSTHYGLYINNSNPVIKRNTISKSGKTGLYLYNTSINVGVTRQNMGNRIESNGMTGSTAWDRSEVVINFGAPGFKYCHNDFVNPNASTNKLVYIMNGSIPAGCGNYWLGYGPDPEFWFLPDGAIDDVSSWDVTNNRPAFTSTVDLIALASSFELQGDYEGAADTYMQALEADNDVLGLSGWIRCQTMLGTATSTILAEVETWIDDETTVGESAFWFSIALQNGMADFETSIDELDAYIDGADSPEDSLRGVFGQLVTYYQMAHADEGGLGVMNYTGDNTESQPFGLPQLGRLNFPVPRNETDYMRKSDELLSMFGQIHNQEFGDNSGLPTSYALRQNYPNPFNPTTTLSFDLMRPETVKLSVYNIMGQEVAKLVDRPMQAGTHSVAFDASQLASGMYFYRIEAGSFTDMKRMVLVK